MDHASINELMNSAIIFKQDMCYLRWLRGHIFDAIEYGVAIPWDVNDPTPAVDQLSAADLQLYDLDHWSSWSRPWPHDDAADLINAWQQATA